MSESKPFRRDINTPSAAQRATGQIKAPWNRVSTACLDIRPIAFLIEAGGVLDRSLTLGYTGTLSEWSKA